MAVGSLLIFAAVLFIYQPHLHPGSTLVNLGYESTALAISLASHGSFADPFQTPTGASAFLAPGYPALIAVLIKLFGSGAYGVFAVQWLVTLMIALQLALWPEIASVMKMGYGTGFTAATVWILSDMPRNDVWEAHCAGLLAVTLAASMMLVVERPPSRKTAILHGLLWGVTLLFSPVALLVLMAWSGCLAIAKWLPWRRIALIVGLAAALVAPWMARNYVVFHHVVYVRDNLGLELDLANSDCASYALEINRNSGCFGKTHPNENPEQAAQVRSLGEIEYDHRHMAVAKRWIADHPAQFVKLSAQRALAFWMPSAVHYPWENEPPRRRWITTLLTLLSIPGLILLWRRSHPAAMICLVWSVFFPAIYYLVQYSERFRAPILWATFFPAVFAITEAARRLLALVTREEAPTLRS